MTQTGAGSEWGASKKGSGEVQAVKASRGVGGRDHDHEPDFFCRIWRKKMEKEKPPQVCISQITKGHAGWVCSQNHRVGKGIKKTTKLTLGSNFFQCFGAAIHSGLSDWAASRAVGSCEPGCHTLRDVAGSPQPLPRYPTPISSLQPRPFAGTTGLRHSCTSVFSCGTWGSEVSPRTQPS